jgi:hypothetical protein
MASSNSSSGSSSTAARQVVALWKSRQHAKLLKQPPPAVFSGRAKEAAQETRRLLLLVADELTADHTDDCSTTAAQQLLTSFMQVQAGALPQLLAALIAWLQQLPQQLAATVGRTSYSPAGLWQLCMCCLSGIIILTGEEGDSEETAAAAKAHSARLAGMLEDAGGLLISLHDNLQFSCFNTAYV